MKCSTRLKSRTPRSCVTRDRWPFSTVTLGCRNGNTSSRPTSPRWWRGKSGGNCSRERYPSRLLPGDRPKDPGGCEPAEVSGARWRECLDVETADRPFLEFERRSNREQAGGQLANGGLMSDERNPLTCPVAAKLLDDLGGRAGRRQGARGRDRRLAGLRYDLSGLPGAQ